MAKKKKGGVKVFTWIMIAVMAAGLVLSVVGIFTDWIQTEGSGLGALADGSTTTLQDMYDSQKEMQKLDEDAKIENFDATYTFAWITLIGSAVALGGYLLGSLLKLKLFNLVGMLGGIVALLAGIMAAIFTGMMCKNMSVDGGILGSSEVKFAIGCYLTLIGGIVSGGAAVLAKANK